MKLVARCFPVASCFLLPDEETYRQPPPVEDNGAAVFDPPAWIMEWFDKYVKNAA